MHIGLSSVIHCFEMRKQPVLISQMGTDSHCFDTGGTKRFDTRPRVFETDDLF